MRPLAPVLGTLLLLAATAAAQPAYDREVRGVWVTNVDSDVLSSKARIAEAMDYLAARGFNVVFPVVWNKGYTLHPSAVMDSVFGIRQDPAFAAQGRDPLAELVVEAHRNGMEVIPWFEYGFAAHYTGFSDHLLAARPEWAAVDYRDTLLVRNGFVWMNALDPDVQAFMLALIDEVLARYDVDGVQGDDRLPALPVEGGYSAVTRKLYRDAHGGQEPPADYRDPAWVRWRADRLTTFAGRIHRAVKARNPNALVSFAPSVWPWSRENYLQDWPRWLDSSYVDLLHPQVYRWDLPAYRNEIDRMLGPNGFLAPADHPKIAPGLLVKSGSRFNDPPQVRRMVDAHRRYDAGGEVYFFYEGMREQNNFLADTLHLAFYGAPAGLPGREGIWRPPPVVVHETDTAMVRTGAWVEDPFAAGFAGTALAAGAGSGSEVVYTLEAEHAGTYDVFAFVPPVRGPATPNTPYAVEAGGARVDVALDQNAPSTTGWMRLGAVTLGAGEAATVTLRQDDTTGGPPTYADAVMLMLDRARTPDLVIDVAPTAVEDGSAFASGFVVRGVGVQVRTGRFVVVD